MMRRSSSLGCALGALVVLCAACGRKPDAYEKDNACENATPLAIGETQKHTTHLKRDPDWVKFDVKSGKKYKVKVHTPSKKASMTVYDSCAEVGQTAGQHARGTAASVLYTAKADGTAVARMAARPGAEYTVTVTVIE